jgi:hypothetical protein
VSKPERRSLRLLTVLVAIAIVTVVSLFGVSAGHTVLSAVLITVLVGVVASSPIALVAWSSPTTETPRAPRHRARAAGPATAPQPVLSAGPGSAGMLRR